MTYMHLGTIRMIVSHTKRLADWQTKRAERQGESETLDSDLLKRKKESSAWSAYINKVPIDTFC